MYGVKNGQTKIAAALNATDFVVRCEKGARTNVDGRLALSTTMENICIEGDTQSTEAIRVSEANKPVGVYSLGSDTTGPITYLPRSEMVNMFILPTDTSHVVVVCPSESVSRIAIMSEKGDMLESGTCEGRGGYPGKLVFDADGERFRSGEVVRTIDSTSSPFLMYSNEDGAPGALWKNRLVNVWGMFQSRGSTVHDPKVIFKDEQFVVPGEHRDIDVEENGDNRVHINKLLLNKREFSQREKPTFHFRYTPQTSGIMQSVRGAFGVAPFTVDKVSLVHASIGLIEDVPMKITYGENNEWQVEFEGNGEKMRPGKYTLKVNLSEGGEGYEDSFIATMGWNDGTEQEVFTMDELIAKFSLDRVQRSGARFDEKRLLWMNGHFVRELPLDELINRVEYFWPESAKKHPEDYKRRVLALAQDRLKTLKDLPMLTSYFFETPTPQPQLILDNKQLKKLSAGEINNLLEQVKTSFEACDDWQPDALQVRLNQLLEQTGQSPAVLFCLVRIVTTWAPFSPQLNDTLSLLGRERTLDRLAFRL
jgi:hypothetical protein